MTLGLQRIRIRKGLRGNEELQLQKKKWNFKISSFHVRGDAIVSALFSSPLIPFSGCTTFEVYIAVCVHISSNRANTLQLLTPFSGLCVSLSILVCVCIYQV